MGTVAQGFFCSSSGIFQHVYESLIADITSDSGVSFFIVRALHNKPIYAFILTLRCYLHFFDPYVFATITSPFIVPLIYIGLFKLAKNKLILSTILLFPLFVILILRNILPDFYIILKIYYSLIAIYGFFFLLIRVAKVKKT